MIFTYPFLNVLNSVDSVYRAFWANTLLGMSSNANNPRLTWLVL